MEALKARAADKREPGTGELREITEEDFLKEVRRAWVRLMWLSLGVNASTLLLWGRRRSS
jgi:hypothetical protein